MDRSLSEPGASAVPGGIASGLVAVVALALFVITVAPTVPFGDGGELIAAAASFGVAHPPGYPLYTALGWLALLIPVGEPALRMNLMSAWFGALACGAVSGLVWRTTASRAAAATSGLVLAGSSTLWSVATVTEVYTLHVALTVAVLWAAAATCDGANERARVRGLIAAAAALGVGLGHHPTIVLALPAAAILGARRRPDDDRDVGVRRLSRWLPAVSPRWFAVAAAVTVVVPAAAYLGMMLRARAEPLANWGRPADLPSLWVHVTAAGYRYLDVGWAGILDGSGWRVLGSTVVREFTPVVLPLAAIGLIGLRGSRQTTLRIRLAAIALMAAGAAFGLRYATEDREVFFLPVFVGLAIAAGLGVASLRKHDGTWVRRVGLAMAVLAALAPAVTHVSSRNMRGATAAADYGRDILDTVPPHGVLFVETDEAYPLLYLTQVLGERGDVRVYSRNGTLFRDVVHELQLPRRGGEPWRAYQNRVEQTFIDGELGDSGGGAVHFLGWPGYDAPPRYRMEPVGLLNRIVRREEAVRDDRPVWARYHERSVREQAERTGDSFALAVAATYSIARGERALFLGDRVAADNAFDEAAGLGSAQASVLSYIGTLYGRIGDYARAIEMFERAVAVKPTYFKGWNNLAMARGLAGDSAGARRAWSRSLELEPDQGDVRKTLQTLDPHDGPGGARDTR